MMKIGKGYNLKIALVMVSGLFLCSNLLYASHEYLRVPLGNYGEIEKVLFSNKNLEEYLENENLFYPHLSARMKKIVTKRIRALEKVMIKTSDDKRTGLIQFIKEVLSKYGYEDRLEHITVFGSYLFAPEPKDIEFEVGLKGNANDTPDFLEVIDKINKFIQEQHLKVILPKDSDCSIDDVTISFIGEGLYGRSSNREEYLAYLYLYSGVTIYGKPIFMKGLDLRVFIDMAEKDLTSLSYKIHKGYDTTEQIYKKPIYRLFHAAVILQRLSPKLSKYLNPSHIYRFIEKYFSSRLDEHEQAGEALSDLDSYLTSKKAQSVLAYFLVSKIGLLAEGVDEKAQIEAIKKLSTLCAFDNTGAIGTIWDFKEVDNPRVKAAFAKYTQPIMDKIRRYENFPAVANFRYSSEVLILDSILGVEPDFEEFSGINAERKIEFLKNLQRYL